MHLSLQQWRVFYFGVEIHSFGINYFAWFSNFWKLILEYLEGQSASKCARIPNDSKHYFSPSNALKTNSIYFLDRKIINVCSDKSKIQTSGRAAPKNSVLEVFLERKTPKKSDFWTFPSKWTSTCCRPTGWFGKISRYADSNVKCKHPYGN